MYGICQKCRFGSGILLQDLSVCGENRLLIHIPKYVYG